MLERGPIQNVPYNSANVAITGGTIKNTPTVATAAKATAGTVSAGGARTVVFSAAADCALCKVGSTLVADGDTRIIVALPGSPNVTVETTTTWAGATVITSLQDPISQHKDSAGNVDMYVNALGGIGLLGGIGNTQKGIRFGDGQDGIFGRSTNYISVQNAGVVSWDFGPNYFGSYDATGALLLQKNVTNILPSMIPRGNDVDTGIGSAIADQLSHIAGGVEAIRLTETTAKMVEKFACSALGGVGRVAHSVIANITANATVTIQTNIPVGAKILGVQMRVDVALAAGETWIATYSGGASQSIATDQAVAVNTKVNKFFDENAATAIASAETDIAITKTGGGAFTAQGTIRAVVYYEEFTNLSDV